MDRSARLFYAAGAILAVALTLAAMQAESMNDARHLAAVRGDVQNRLLETRDRLQGHLVSDMQLVKGLISVVRLDPKLALDRFSEIAPPLLAGRTNLRNIVLAPDMIIRQVYPLAGNEKAMGLNYRNLPAQFATADLARQTRQIVLAGPVKLVQGGEGFIARLPVYLNDAQGRERFWGIISAVIDSRRLFVSAGLDDVSSIEIALRGSDAKGAQGEIFFGRPETFANDPVLSEIHLPYGSWQLAAIPRDGWPLSADNHATVRAGLGVLSLFLIGSFVAMGWAAQKTAQAKVRAERANQRLMATLENSPHVAVQWFDIDGRVTYWNPASEHLYGYSAAEACGKTLDQLIFTPEQAARFVVTLRQIAHHGEATAPIDIPVRHRAGNELWISAANFAIPGETADMPIMVCMDTDISERVESQARLHDAMERAEAANVAKSQFLATMSHEIRTPLNGILGMAQLLLMGGHDDDERKEFVRIIFNSGKTLLTLLNDILDLSKIEAGKVELEQLPFDPKELVLETVMLFGELAAGKGLTLERQTTALAMHGYLGDAVRIRQMLSNLVSNAIKFTEQGFVRISVTEVGMETDQPQLEFAVTDSGVGIHQDKQAQLFQMFTQTDSSITRQYGGSGLGLAIVRQLAQLHGGDAGLRSTPGEGSRFWFRVRVTVLPEDTDRRSEVRPNATTDT